MLGRVGEAREAGVARLGVSHVRLALQRVERTQHDTGRDLAIEAGRAERVAHGGVGVASTDAFGNVGALSSVACGMPQEVTGFYEAYRAAGGKAGGGFCGFAPARRGAAPILLGLVLGAVALLRRRR